MSSSLTTWLDKVETEKFNPWVFNKNALGKILGSMGDGPHAVLFELANAISSKKWKDGAPTIVVNVPVNFGIYALISFAAGLAQKSCDENCAHIPMHNRKSMLSFYSGKMMMDALGIKVGNELIKIENGISFTKNLDFVNAIPAELASIRKNISCRTNSLEKKIGAIQSFYDLPHEIAGITLSQLSQHPVLVIGNKADSAASFESLADYLPRPESELVQAMSPALTFQHAYRSLTIWVNSNDIKSNSAWIGSIKPKVIVIKGSSLRTELPVSWMDVPRLVILDRRSESSLRLLEAYHEEAAEYPAGVPSIDYQALRKLDAKVLTNTIVERIEPTGGDNDEDW